MSIIEKCANSVARSKQVRNLNIFISECFETANKQAELSEKRHKSKGKTLILFVIFVYKFYKYIPRCEVKDRR